MPTDPEAARRSTAPQAPGGVAVVGAGAVGSLLAACLAIGGLEVALVDRRLGYVATARGATAGGGQVLVTPDGTRTLARLTRVPDVASLAADTAAIIVAVKQFDIPTVLDALQVLPGVPVVTAQNGVGAEATVLARRPAAPLVGASLTAATALDPDGAARWLRVGGIGLAGVQGDTTALLARLMDAFDRACLPATVFPDAGAMKWSKLVANLVGNATSAIVDMSPGEIYKDRRLFRIERRQIHEAVAVMHALGLRPVALPGAHVQVLLRGLGLPEIIGRPVVARAIAGARGGKSPSLRLHVRGGGVGPTEARWLNGAVAEAGRHAGVPAPVNACLAALVDEVAADPERAAWFAGRPDRLADAIVAWETRP